MTISVGDQFPLTGVHVHENTPGNEVNLESIFKGKTVVIFGVPGAFTPGCNKTHLPGYIKDYSSIKSKGVDEIVCIAVNDAFVMAEWGKASGAEGKVRMIADTNAELSKKLGLDFNAAALGGTRCKRFSAVVKDGIVKQINVEPDGTGLTCSLSNGLKLPVQ